MSIYFIIKRKTNIVKEMISCFFFSLFLLSPTIFTSLFDLLNCKEYDMGNYIKNFMYNYPENECYTNSYYNWIFFLVVPSLVIYALILPLTSLIYLFNIKNLLINNDKNYKDVEFLIRGYKRQKFYT